MHTKVPAYVVFVLSNIDIMQQMDDASRLFLLSGKYVLSVILETLNLCVMKKRVNRMKLYGGIYCMMTILSTTAGTTDAYAQARMDEMWGEQNSRSVSRNESRGHLFEWGNYAMFIHWGLYSHIGNMWKGKTYYGIGEWMMDKNMAGIGVDEYMSVAGDFNPVNFDADKIVKLAKDAGMKYIVITSKHHDGFAMYDSDCSSFNIVDATPFGRDPMKELATACKKAGLGFGFYYSHNQDWTTPGASGGPRVDAEGNAQTFDDYYKSKCLPQVEEITKNYGDMVLIWFDTPGDIPEKYVRELVDVVHRNQPDALVSGRAGYGLGDYQTLGDMDIPLENIEGLWESVDVTNDAWGYSWYDNNWKSPKLILENLVSTVARGGTYMLNVGLDGLGNIPEFASQTLEVSGKWVGRYPYVVYGAEPSPWKHALPWGDVVKQGDKLYLVVYEWPESGKLYVPGLKTEVKSVRLMRGEKSGGKLKFSNEGTWTVVDLPTERPEKMLSVIEMKMASDSIVVDNTLAVDPDLGLKNLSVLFAKTDNCSIYKSGWMEKFGEWKHKDCVGDLDKGGVLTWTVDVKSPGVYDIKLQVRGNGRYVWKVETDENNFVQNQQRATSIFTDSPIGWLKFDKAGRHTLSVRLLEGGKADLTSVSIVPVDLQ